MRYAKLKGKMRELGITQADLAKKLELSEVALNKKLNGKSQFKVIESIEIMKVFDEPLSSIPAYFFEQ